MTLKINIAILGLICIGINLYLFWGEVGCYICKELEIKQYENERIYSFTPNGTQCI